MSFTARAIVLFFTLLPAFAVSQAAFAKTVAESAIEWGLAGTWAIDCSVPPDRATGSRLIYSIKSGGRVVHERDFGDASDTNEVLSARVGDDGAITLRVNFSALKDTREYALSREPDGAMRAVYNRGSNGVYTIREGKFVGNGQPAPKQFKCDTGVD